jgi:hypothetical protein
MLDFVFIVEMDDDEAEIEKINDPSSITMATTPLLVLIEKFLSTFIFGLRNIVTQREHKVIYIDL